MRAALAVGDAGGFSAAALSLGRTQPAISRSIAELERRLGVDLFSRGIGGTRPTAAGEIIIERARRAVGQLMLISPELARTASDHEIHAALAIDAAGSLTAAARNMQLSQSAVSQALSALESRLGQRLFERSALSATRARNAAEILKKFSLAIAEIEQGLEEVRFLTGATDGRLRIGA